MPMVRVLKHFKTYTATEINLWILQINPKFETTTDTESGVVVTTNSKEVWKACRRTQVAAECDAEKHVFLYKLQKYSCGMWLWMC